LWKGQHDVLGEEMDPLVTEPMKKTGGLVDIGEQSTFWAKERRRRHPSHRVISAFVEPVLAEVRATIGLDKKKTDFSILDIGCGNGYYSYYLAHDGKLVCLDFSSYMLSINPCKQRVCALSEKLPFPDNTFDLVFCSNLLHHLETPQVALNEMERVARHHVVVAEPNRASLPLLYSLKKEERGMRKFSLSYVVGLFQKSQLHVQSAKRMGVILPNKMPGSLLPLFKWFNRPGFWGFYVVVIGEKQSSVGSGD
jgi:SAM-dependent methyltransferase